jgi:pyridoxine 5-phosphate synthase
MVKLSVNINKIATLRNARGGNIPDVIRAAIDIQRFGADGITVHPRPDQRHITYEDVRKLRTVVSTEFNVEGFPSEDFLALVLEVKPEQVTLVPDPPGAITSNAGWDTISNMSFLKSVVAKLKAAGIRTSLFTGTEPDIIMAAKATGTDRIELYTEPYALHYRENPENAVKDFRNAGLYALEAGLGLNAGHDLSLENLAWFAKEVPGLLEVSIGHALISDALYFGLENTVQLYKNKIL